MSSLVKPVKDVTYTPDRVGYIRAVSRQESSSDLRYSYTYKGKNKEGGYVDNPASVRRLNPWDYVGLFQFSEIALEDVGCYKKDKTRNGEHQDWGNKKDKYWTNKYGASSFDVFRNSGEIQLKAIQYWIDRLCNYMRNINANEFYGKTITEAKDLDPFEVTESGVIAARHLKGDDAVVDFLTSNGKINKVDGNKTSVGKYMSLFAHYNLQTCCKRKVYVKIVDAKKVGIPNKEVEISSEFKGTFNLGKIVVTHKTDKDGNLPIIVRHPEAKIQLKIDANLVETIIQKADQLQGYEILYLGESKYSSKLSKHEKLQTTKESKDTDSSTNSVEPIGSNQHSEGSDNNEKIDEVTFNIKLVEADTGKPLPKATYHLEYKNNIKPHRTDSSGIESGIKADISQSISVYLDDDGGKKQSIYSMAFPVTGDLNGQTKVLKVPVVTLQLIFIDKNKKPVPNYEFKTVYRGRTSEIRKANARGIATVKALAGQQLKVIHVAANKFTSNIVTDGSTEWTYSTDKLIENNSSSTGSASTSNAPSTTPPSQKPSSTKPSTSSEVNKGTVIRDDKVTQQGPTHEVRTKQAKITIKFLDEATDKPLSGLTYWTQSTKYGKNASTTGSDGTRGRTHDSDVGISIAVIVNENGKEIKKGTIIANSDKNGVAYVYKAKKPKLDPGGAHWHSRFKASTSLDDLSEPFKSNAKKFISALKAANISVRISTTYRPDARSYLMYYSTNIKRGKISPEKVPPWPGVNIDWTHGGNKSKAVEAARAMHASYGIGGNPVGKPSNSNHNVGLAVDMTVTNYSGKTISLNGNKYKINEFNDLVAAGKKVSVIWYGSKDKPHWSQTGR
ncbi:hypothetical protein [Psychrobacter sp. GW64-MNA-CIBAN-0177]|uniref:hypothetical protein n=1 Tax=Psychrobacter sp. GW64-MNA-CIBAN-0177 TaxID=3140449 RepID=UPI00332A449C